MTAEQDRNRERIIAEFEAEHGRKPKFGEIRDYPGMNGLSVVARQGRAAPEQRVRAYLDLMADAIDRQSKAGGWVYGETIHGLDGVELTLSDIRDVLAELDAANARVDELEAKRNEAIHTLSPLTIYTASIGMTARKVIEVLSDER